ncbi:dipeptide epimerase [Halorubellus sp. PRR65]|uniref:dipeptide epimerase n=1 Tax=Halorubellus sp. PRR65 TaxID=3098148 RepID=UPI002B25B8DA|nr:dipeptide epimerase [Halorubellus sp. PRR65]
MTLELDAERVALPLADTFTISRGSQDVAENVVVRVRTDEGGTDAVGVGAAAPSRHYGETAATVEAVLPDLEAAIADVDPFRTRRIEAACRRAVNDNPAARAAVSVAVHDLVAKRLDVPLHRYLGLDPEAAPATSFTIGLDTVERIREKAERAADAGYETLKVKVGTDRDRAVVDAVREGAPDATLRVDANEAWTPKEAVRKTEWLADAGVEFVEQPVSATDPDGLRYVYERSPLPIAVDESCVVPSDVPRVADRADIVTCKLMKCGGVQAARDLFAAARAHGMQTMLGCMVETNAAIAAGAHLAPLCDHVDLDGSLLLADDPYDGPVREGGAIAFDDRPGTGAVER